MILKLLGPKRASRIRSPFGRALAAAVLSLGFVLVVLHAKLETLSMKGPVFGKNGFRASSSRDQRPMSGQGVVSPLPTLNKTLAVGAGAELNCSIDVTHLAAVKQRHKLDDKFQYMKRHIRFTRKEGLERRRMTKLPQRLLSSGDFQTIDQAKSYGDQACDEPLEVEVPASGLPAAVNASDFMFGVSTTYRRFMEPATTPIREWTFWLTDSHGHSNGGKLLLMLADASDDELQEVANLLGDVGVDVDVYHSDSSADMAIRYLALVPTLAKHAQAASRKWLVTCDDDTFFPSMHGLMARMARLDHTRDMYVGTLSEDVRAVERHSSQAFGGAGVFLSRSMADKITELYGSCTAQQKLMESNKGWGPQGDLLLRKCIYENTETRLTTIWDLWQLDIMGDPSGFYEWGIKPLSLHHYRGTGPWHLARPAEYTKIAHTCGEDCTLLRLQTADDFVLSGYSVAHYPDGAAALDFAQMEATMHPAPEDKGWNLDFVFGPQRPSLEKTGRKISWEMQESEVRADGSVLQTYTRKRDDSRWVHKDGQPMSDIDGIIELVWIPS